MTDSDRAEHLHPVRCAGLVRDDDGIVALDEAGEFLRCHRTAPAMSVTANERIFDGWYCDECAEAEYDRVHP